MTTTLSKTEPALRSTKSRIVVHGRATTLESPLLAVCGVSGGAGVSTLSALIASAAARDGHVLLADTGGPAAGLFDFAGVQTSFSSVEAAPLIARDIALAPGTWAIRRIGGHELRVIAAPPAPEPDGDAAPFEEMLDVARRALGHSLVIVDCGTLQRGPERRVVLTASHVVWVLAATPAGVARARRVCALADLGPRARELLVARHIPTSTPARHRDLTALADRLGAPLVQLPDFAAEPRRAAERTSSSVDAILGVIRR